MYDLPDNFADKVMAQIMQQMEKPISFTHSNRNMFQKQFGTFLIRFLFELHFAGVVECSEKDAPTIDAITDQFADKFIEILDGKRSFNW